MAIKILGDKMYGGYLTDVKGIKVGHMEDQANHTGTTVILIENGAVAGVDVRGFAPGTRETDLLKTEKSVNQIHGLVLTGGSAFGLDTAGGVMKFLEEKDIGIDVVVTKVPIVPGAVIFDLFLGDPKIRPNFDFGYRAAQNASEKENRQGNVGAGSGATVGKIIGPKFMMKSGLGSASVAVGDLIVSAMVVVNAFGDIFDLDNKQIAGVYDSENNKFLSTIDIMKSGELNMPSITNTTIGVVASNANLNKAEANKLAQVSHNAYAKRIRPVHTNNDGDTIFSIATGEINADTDLVGVLAVEAMEKAIINAIKHARSIGGIISYSDI